MGIARSSGAFPFSGVTPVNYSLTETPIGQNWIDGSPIYRKVVSVGTLPNDADEATAHGIVTIGDLVRMWGWAENPGSVRIPLPYAPDTAGGVGSVTIRVDNANITVAAVDIDASAFTGYVILEYTKV